MSISAATSPNPNQVAASATYESLPSTPGKVSWTIPATALRKGRGYSFHLTWHTSGCRYGRVTTWAHNRPTVDGGATPCTLGPPAQPTGWQIQKRMWHSAGANDRDPACASYQTSWAFDPTMPQGWLMTNGKWVYTATGWESPPSAQTACGTTAAQGGARVVFWRPNPEQPSTRGDYVCKWPQYESLNQTTDHGWYHGIPRKSDGSGAPRDTYLKLDTIDYDALLQRHAPILKYDSGEAFHVLSPGALTDFYVESGIRDWSNTLKDGEGEFAIANPAFGESLAWELDLLTLDYLRPTYRSGESPPSRRAGTQATASDFVSARGSATGDNYDDDARYMELQPAYPYKVYARATHGGDGKLWLQYWFFYYYNPDPSGGLGGEHEGDWEMIQVGLKGDLTPEKAVYAQHNTRQSCDWNSTAMERAGDVPVVYVAQHSHASYFAPYPLPWPFEIYDRADGQGGGLFQPDLEPIREEAPAWAAWQGSWGDSGSSPQGPRFQPGEKWSDPSAWAANAPTC